MKNNTESREIPYKIILVNTSCKNARIGVSKEPVAVITDVRSLTVLSVRTVGYGKIRCCAVGEGDGVGLFKTFASRKLNA